jgi:hypothetical protein
LGDCADAAGREVREIGLLRCSLLAQEVHKLICAWPQSVGYDTVKLEGQVTEME